MIHLIRRPPLVVLLGILLVCVQTSGKTQDSTKAFLGLVPNGEEQHQNNVVKAVDWLRSQEGAKPHREVKPAQLAETLMQLAKTGKLERSYVESESLMKSAIQLAEAHGLSDYLQAHYYFQLSSLYILLHEKDKALESLKRASERSIRSGNEALIAACSISKEDVEQSDESPARAKQGGGSFQNHQETLPSEEASKGFATVWLVMAVVLVCAGGLFWKFRMNKWRLGQKATEELADKSPPVNESPQPSDTELRGTEARGPKKSVWIREKNKRWIHVEVAEIMSIEAQNNNVDMHTVTKTYKEIGVSLLNMSRQLEHSGFIRTHRSFLVNTAHLKVIEDNSLFLTKGKAPIGESYRKDLFERLHLLRSTFQKTEKHPL